MTTRAEDTNKVDEENEADESMNAEIYQPASILCMSDRSKSAHSETPAADSSSKRR